MAKESVTKQALQEGVVVLLKMHNSMTTKVCRQLGLSIPGRVEEHDPPDEENSAGLLGQMIQEITRNPQALECQYTSSHEAGGEYKITSDKSQNSKVECPKPTFMVQD